MLVKSLALIVSLAGLVVVSGCGPKPPSEEALRSGTVNSLTYERDGIVRLQGMAKNAGSFVPEVDDNETEPSDFDKQLTSSLKNLQKAKENSGTYESDIAALVAQLEKIKAMNPTAPSPALTAAVDEAVALAEKLPQRKADDKAKAKTRD